MIQEDNFLGNMSVYNQLLKNIIVSSEAERKQKLQEEYNRIRYTYKYTFEEFEYDNKFKEKYNIYPGSRIFKLKTPNGYFDNYLFGYNIEMLKIEKKLNSERFVHLTPYFEEKYSDEIMVSCHGNNWKVADENTGKPASPWHLSKYDVIFDTETCEIIFESDKNSYEYTYIYFFDNVAKIHQDRHGTIYFNMLDRQNIYISKDEIMLETTNNLIIGKKDNYGKERYPAIVINKHTCQTSKID